MNQCSAPRQGHIPGSLNQAQCPVHGVHAGLPSAANISVAPSVPADKTLDICGQVNLFSRAQESIGRELSAFEAGRLWDRLLEAFDGDEEAAYERLALFDLVHAIQFAGELAGYEPEGELTTFEWYSREVLAPAIPDWMWNSMDDMGTFAFDSVLSRAGDVMRAAGAIEVLSDDALDDVEDDEYEGGDEDDGHTAMILLLPPLRDVGGARQPMTPQQRKVHFYGRYGVEPHNAAAIQYLEDNFTIRDIVENPVLVEGALAYMRN